MFGRNDDQNQTMGDISNISLPGQQPSGSPQFATPNPQPSVPVQDLSIPELTASTEPTISSSDQPWPSQPTHSQSVGSDDLSALKQQALSQLTPLVGHLEQTPEEKFRTTMMMIQAADDQTLIKSAYDAAQQIPDEKAKAQALLDVINEINYFSQKQQQN